MTLTYSKLLKFVIELKKEGYENTIPEAIFFTKLRKTFGVSKYTMTSVAKNLHNMGLMKPLNNGVWEILITEKEMIEENKNPEYSDL